MHITVPALSAASLHQWLVEIGTVVTIGQPLAILVTPTQELAIPATRAGVVAELLVAEGDAVSSNAPIIRLAAESSAVRQRVTPLARRIAAANSVDLMAVTGSGIRGRIGKRDVLAFRDADADRAPDGGFCIAEQMGNTLHSDEQTITVPAPKPTPAPPAIATADPRRSTLVPWTQSQRDITHVSVGSNAEIPHVITALTVDLGAVGSVCRRQNAVLTRRGITITPTACLVLATVRALQRHPQLVASWAGDDEQIQRAERHLAVQHPRGTTSITNAADLSLLGIARALAQPPTTISPTTFTLVHSDAALWSAPLVAPDQAAVLHVGASRPAVGVREIAGTAQLVIEHTATVTLAYDARLLSDDSATQFLLTLREELGHL